MGKSSKRMIDFEERKLIEKHLKRELSCTEISKLISRSKNAVVTEVRKNGGREKYCAKEAQKLVELTKKERYQKLSERNRKMKNVSSLGLRIQSLEMQIEILHETIKEMKK